MGESHAKDKDAAPNTSMPLDDVMLAMDVVDTLRRQERMVALELDEVQRRQDLKQRLRTIYAQQGIEVPDHILEEGVAALKQDRFTYKPPPPGIVTRLARIYVTRASWGKFLLGGVGVIALAVAVGYYTLIAPNARLPSELEARYQSIVEIAATEHAREALTSTYNAGKAAIQNDDRDSVKQALIQLDVIKRTLAQEYTIRVVNRANERSGVWRVPDINTQARNYYLIVEALDATGKVQQVSITNEETGATETVTTWGLRVDEDTFNRVASDKQDNGIIENNRVGSKKLGHLRANYSIATTGGAITKW